MARNFPGYAKRYGATYGDRLSSTFLGAALLPSLLHQDPRYFYRGHGHIMVRAMYAISTVAVCKGDNGRWQPNYSNVLGNLGAAGISTLYYPQQRSARRAGDGGEYAALGLGPARSERCFRSFFFAI